MIAAPLLFALATWFLGTASVVWLVSRPRHTFARSLAIGGAMAIGALLLVWVEARDAGAGSAYASFAAAILVWGWHEMAFLTGAVAGSSRTPCPSGAIGLRRFRAATATVIHHELALAATAILLAALTWGQANQVAPLTFLLLFVMRLSAKFNLYFGVPNLSDEIFPAHLEHLKSYFRTARCNWLFPCSIALGCAIVAACWQAADAAIPGSGAATGGWLLAGLAALAVVEHLFLVLPMRDAKMFGWATSHKAAKAAVSD